MSKKFLDPARHEPADVDRRFIWAGVALVLVAVFSAGLIVLWIYPGATTDRTLRLPVPRYPDPQLQVNSAADMARFRDEEMRQLNRAGWVDKTNWHCAHPHSRCDAQNRPGKYSWLARGDGAARRARERSCFARASRAAP